MKKILFALVALSCGSIALADGGACGAQALNGRWSCGGKTITFNVSVKNGVYQLNPTESLSIPVVLDGQPHTFTSAGMSLETTGTCQGQVVTIEGTEQDMLNFSEQITIESASKLSVQAIVGGSSPTITCTKE